MFYIDLFYCIFMLLFNHCCVQLLRPHGLQHVKLLCPPLSLFKFMFIESVTLSNYLILCCPLFLSPSIFASIRVFSRLALHIRQPKYWSFSFTNSPSNEYSCLISFRIDLFDLLAVPGTLKSLLQLQPSDQISRSVVSDSLRPRESQHARHPCTAQTEFSGCMPS